MAQAAGEGIEAARVCREKGGRLYAVDCTLHYSRPLTVEAAVERARAGKTVFVRREDAAQVLAAMAAGELERCARA